jgi:hypothetical protein
VNRKSSRFKPTRWSDLLVSALLGLLALALVAILVLILLSILGVIPV